MNYKEKLAIYEKAKRIVSCSDLFWKEKYDLIFSDEISSKFNFDWTNQDADYSDDVLAFMDGFTEYMEKQKIIHEKIDLEEEEEMRFSYGDVKKAFTEAFCKAHEINNIPMYEFHFSQKEEEFKKYMNKKHNL